MGEAGLEGASLNEELKLCGQNLTFPSHPRAKPLPQVTDPGPGPS